jgi:hypothetical protein
MVAPTPSHGGFTTALMHLFGLHRSRTASASATTTQAPALQERQLTSPLHGGIDRPRGNLPRGSLLNILA